jgi:hypothetical protein
MRSGGLGGRDDDVSGVDGAGFPQPSGGTARI